MTWSGQESSDWVQLSPARWEHTHPVMMGWWFRLRRVTHVNGGSLYKEAIVVNASLAPLLNPYLGALLATYGKKMHSSLFPYMGMHIRALLFVYVGCLHVCLLQVSLVLCKCLCRVNMMSCELNRKISEAMNEVIMCGWPCQWFQNWWWYGDGTMHCKSKISEWTLGMWQVAGCFQTSMLLLENCKWSMTEKWNRCAWVTLGLKWMLRCM